MKKYLTEHHLPQKALLLLDNASCHSKDLQSTDGTIVCMYFPPNVTALIQPMDQNVINLLKISYKKSFLEAIIASEETNIAKCIKSFNLRDAMHLLSSAWNQIASKSIEKCWTKIMPRESEWDEEDNLPLSILGQQLRQQDADEFALARLLVQITPGNEFIGNEEIRDWVEDAANENLDNENVSTDSDSDIEEIPEPQKTISSGDALHKVNQLLDYLVKHEFSTIQIEQLNILKHEIIKKTVEKKK